MKEIPITFKSENKQLVGMLHFPNKKNVPCVIMCHGYFGDKLGNTSRMFVKTARYFSKNDIASLRFDFFGCGDSEGNFEELIVTKQIENLGAAIDFVGTIDGINKNKIGVLGWSRGSAICILRASKDKRIKSVVSWAGEADFREQWPKQYIIEAKKRGYFYSKWYNMKIPYKAYVNELKYSILKSLKKMYASFLVIHGSLDENVTLSQGEALYNNANKSKKIVVLKGADHSFTGFEKQVMRESFSWFKKWLK